MGWTSYRATHYDKSGKIDRKAECDNLFNSSCIEVIKSSMVGSIYYAAAKHTEYYFNKYNDGVDSGKVFAIVCITSVDNKDPYYNFSYKDMDETVGPCYYDCPLSILKLLTTTDSEFANEWRNKCYEKLSSRKSSFTSLPLGTKIEFEIPFDTNSIYKKGDLVTIQKVKSFNKKSSYWTDGIFKFSRHLVNHISNVIENNYKVIISEVQ